MRRLLGLTRPHRATLAVAIAAGMVALAAGLAVPPLTKRLVDDGIRGGRPEVIWPLSLAVLAFGALRATANFVRRNRAGITSARIEAGLRGRLFGHLQGLPIAFHDQWQGGQLLARATGDLVAIRIFLGYALVFLTFVGVTYLAVAVAAALLDPLLAALSLALVLPFLALAVRFNRRMENLAGQARESVGALTSVVEESVSGIRVLKAFGQEGRAVARLDAAARRLMEVNLQSVAVRGFYIPALGLVPNLVLAVVLGVGGLRVMSQHLSLGGLVAFNQYLVLLVIPLRFAGWMLAMGQQAVASGRRVFEILDTQPAVADQPGAHTLDRVKGEVHFDAVGFTYPGSSTPALHDVSFTIRPGETVALVGTTGSGKSTVAALLPRFFDPSTGTVRIDGHDIRHVTLASLRRHIGVVFDEPVLFSASIRDNLAFADPSATDEQVVRAAEAAGAHEFIMDLPDGYATAVGELGLSLSGGQRQRVALARALLSQPALLVLDDPLRSVDVETEARIEENLRRLLPGHTTLLIAQRASTVAMADRVLLLEHGRVVAEGTHPDLLASNPAYRSVLASGTEAVAAVADEVTP